MGKFNNWSEGQQLVNRLGYNMPPNIPGKNTLFLIQLGTSQFRNLMGSYNIGPKAIDLMEKMLTYDPKKVRNFSLTILENRFSGMPATCLFLGEYSCRN